MFIYYIFVTLAMLSNGYAAYTFAKLHFKEKNYISFLWGILAILLGGFVLAGLAFFAKRKTEALLKKYYN